MTTNAPVRAVLFDLDGTLLDTAPDMVAALDALLAEQGHGPVDYSRARMSVSQGAIGLINLAFTTLGIELAEAHRLSLRDRYLELYAQQLSQTTSLFHGMADVLTHLETAGLPWGVVTNKPGFLTEPLLDALGLRRRSAALVSGDTLPERKPHPRPLLHAAAAIGIDPGRALYIGDDARDIQAGRAAGMITIVARYGYIEPHQSPDHWGADFAIDEPAELIHLIGRLNAGDA